MSSNLIITEHAHKHRISDKVYTFSDGTIIDDKVAEQITQDVYAALDRGEYKVVTDKTRIHKITLNERKLLALQVKEGFYDDDNKEQIFVPRTKNGKILGSDPKMTLTITPTMTHE